MTVPQARAALGVMKQDRKNREQGYNQQIQDYRKKLDELAKFTPGSSGATTPSGGGKGARTVTTEERQAFQNKVNQVNAMPDGPNKDRLMKQLDDLKRKWGL